VAVVVRFSVDLLTDLFGDSLQFIWDYLLINKFDDYQDSLFEYLLQFVHSFSIAF